MKALALVTLLFVSVATTNAQTAANWNFNSSLSGTPGSHLSSPNANLGSAIPTKTFNGGTEYYGEDGWPTGAIDLNAYMEFSVSPNTGYYLNLNTVTMIIRRSNTGSPQGAGPNNWTLRSSLDGYASDIATNSMTYNYATFTVPLPAAFQSLTSGVTFRLYGYNTTINTGGNSRFVYDNISIQGQANPTLLAQQSIGLTTRTISGGVDLQWKSQGFDAGTRYIVERSVDGTAFTAIYQQTPTTIDQTPTTADAINGQYADWSIPAVAKVFYRIAAQQPDGITFYSPIVTAPGKGSAASAIRSVASLGGVLKAQLHLGETGSYQLNIWSTDGKPLYRQTISGQSGDQTADIALSNYSHGVYILTVSKDGVNTSRQFVL